MIDLLPVCFIVLWLCNQFTHTDSKVTIGDVSRMVKKPQHPELVPSKHCKLIKDFFFFKFVL